jgi:hypothetical protein
LYETIQERRSTLALLVATLLLVSFRGIFKSLADLIKMRTAPPPAPTVRDLYWSFGRATLRFGLLAIMYDSCTYEANTWAESMYGAGYYSLERGPALFATIAAAIPALIGLLGKAAAVTSLSIQVKKEKEAREAMEAQAMEAQGMKED